MRRLVRRLPSRRRRTAAVLLALLAVCLLSGACRSASPPGLPRLDGAFEATDESGQALFGKSGTIVGSSLESSNTDIADEFTKLIVTQQAYSANT